jgi:hypothetical protein
VNASQTRIALATHPKGFGTTTVSAALKGREQDLARKQDKIVERLVSRKGTTVVVEKKAQKVVQDRLMSKRVHDAIKNSYQMAARFTIKGSYHPRDLLEQARDVEVLVKGS